MDAGIGWALGASLLLVVGSFLLVSIGGIALVRRRVARGELTQFGSGRPRRPITSAVDAGTSLFRADTELRDAEDEWAFARAQFGDERTAAFRAVLDAASADLASAFRRQQQVDAGEFSADRARRTSREIRAIAERVRATLALEVQTFRAMRRAEADAPTTVARLRDRAQAITQRARDARATTAELSARHGSAVIAGISDAPDRALTRTTEATLALERIAEQLASNALVAVSAELAGVESWLASAEHDVSAVERRRDEVTDAQARIEKIRAEARAALDRARLVRDAPPDPESGTLVADAIARLDPLVATSASNTSAATAATSPSNPFVVLDDLVTASSRLDVALAAARNQASRLEGAREALAGALFAAKSEIDRAREAVRAAGAGSTARTRLAEAERQLSLAEAASDPVEALDAARRAQTHARDADALARYSG